MKIAYATVPSYGNQGVKPLVSDRLSRKKDIGVSRFAPLTGRVDGEGERVVRFKGFRLPQPETGSPSRATGRSRRTRGLCPDLCISLRNWESVSPFCARPGNSVPCHVLPHDFDNISAP